jgi:hypothetical protein
MIYFLGGAYIPSNIGTATLRWEGAYIRGGLIAKGGLIYQLIRYTPFYEYLYIFLILSGPEHILIARFYCSTIPDTTSCYILSTLILLSRLVYEMHAANGIVRI